MAPGGMAAFRVPQLTSGLFHVRRQGEDVHRRKAQPGMTLEIMPQLPARIAAVKDHQGRAPPAEPAEVMTAETPGHRQEEDAQQPGPHEHDTRIGHAGLAREQQHEDEPEGQGRHGAELAALHIGRQRDASVKSQCQPHERCHQKHGEHPAVAGDVQAAPQGTQAHEQKGTGQKGKKVAQHQQDDTGWHPQALQHALY